MLDIPLEGDELCEAKKEEDDDDDIDTGELAGLGNGCPTRRVLETDVTDRERCIRDESYEKSVFSLSSAHIVAILRLVRELASGAWRTAVSGRAAQLKLPGFIDFHRGRLAGPVDCWHCQDPVP